MIQSGLFYFLIFKKELYTGTTGWVSTGAGPNEPFRSHGGVSEQRVPFLVIRAVDLPADEPLRNFDIYNVLLMDILHGGSANL